MVTAMAEETRRTTEKIDVPKGTWDRCEHCGHMLFSKEYEENQYVCPKCSHHRRVDARTRIVQLVDPGSFEEFLEDLVSTDPLQFKDRVPYAERMEAQRKKTGEHEAVVVGKAYIRGRPVMLVVMNPAFIMASMGSVVGEKITTAIERATDESLPVVVVAASGGARMQEGVVSLMQMAKTSAAIARFDDAGGLYIVVCTDPTTAGVAASFASLGDFIIAEPGAMIGFAGPRVIANTVKQELPEGFQSAEFMLEHGFVDRIVPRSELRKEIVRLIDYCSR